jgi:hypothetical protein
LQAGDKPGDITCIVFAADGKTMLTGGHDLTVRLWDIASRSEIRNFIGHTLNVSNVAFGRDGRTIYSASRDRTLRLWESASGNDLDLGTTFDAYMYGLTISANGQCAIASGGSQIHRIDVSRASGYFDFAPRLESAEAALRRDANDTAALATLGEWYAFRGINDWAASSLEDARAAGGKVSPLLMGRCYWQLNRVEDATAAFREARERNEAPADYVALCLAALRQPSTAPASSPAH